MIGKNALFIIPDWFILFEDNNITFHFGSLYKVNYSSIQFSLLSTIFMLYAACFGSSKSNNVHFFDSQSPT